MRDKISIYIEAINRVFSSGEATGHSYRSEFKQLIEMPQKAWDAYISGYQPLDKWVERPHRENAFR